MTQQIIARWTNPTHDKDGNPYGEGDHDGYVVSLNGGALIKLPLTWGTSFDLGTLPEVEALPSGTHSIVIAPRSKKGVLGRPVMATFPVHPTPAALGNFSITTTG
jgi:hypothetical protein